MYDGKKGVAQKIVYDAFALIEAKMGQNALEVFNAALENVMPVLEVKARRVGGSRTSISQFRSIPLKLPTTSRRTVV